MNEEASREQQYTELDSLQEPLSVVCSSVSWALYSTFRVKQYRVPPSQLIRPLLFGRTLALSLSLCASCCPLLSIDQPRAERKKKKASPFHVRPDSCGAAKCIIYNQSGGDVISSALYVYKPPPGTGVSAASIISNSLAPHRRRRVWQQSSFLNSSISISISMKVVNEHVLMLRER